MEYCPEVAVVQSAFDLVAKQYGKQLVSLAKADCDYGVQVMSGVVSEVVRGLQENLSPEESRAWHQKLHGLVLYKLVRDSYITDAEQTETDSVPVLSSMDVLSGLLPSFSRHLYFELVKHCGWMEYFLESLQHCDLLLSARLLKDLCDHCQSDPVTSEDREVISMVTDAMVTQLLSVPTNRDPVSQSLMEPLLKDQCYVRRIQPVAAVKIPNSSASDLVGCPEPTEMLPQLEGDGKQGSSRTKPLSSNTLLTGRADIDSISTLPAVKADTTDTGGDVTTETSALQVTLSSGTSTALKSTDTVEPMTSLPSLSALWRHVLDTDRTFLQRLVDNCRQFLTSPGSDRTTERLMKIVVQVGLITVLSMPYNTVLSESHREADLHTWLRMNLFDLSSDKGSDSLLQTVDRPYCLDQGLLELIKKIDDSVKQSALDCLLAALEALKRNLSESGAAGDKSTETEPAAVYSPESSSAITDQREPGVMLLDICVAKTLYLKSGVILRMLEGRLKDIPNVEMDTTDSSLLASLIGCLGTLSGRCQGQEMACQLPALDVFWGESWHTDLTLTAVLWRISQWLPDHTECVERLLALGPLVWTQARVLSVLEQHADLLAEPRYIQALMAVQQSLQDPAVPTGHPAGTETAGPGTDIHVVCGVQELMLKAFSEMSWTDQDHVVMETYLSSKEWSGTHPGEKSQATAVFNRVTSSHDPKVLKELFRCALHCPWDVVKTAVQFCVRNVEQARNMAQLLREMPELCTACHPTHHPDGSLLSMVLQDYLGTSQLSRPEQRNFITFLTALMQGCLLKGGVQLDQAVKRVGLVIVCLSGSVLLTQSVSPALPARPSLNRLKKCWSGCAEPNIHIDGRRKQDRKPQTVCLLQPVRFLTGSVLSAVCVGNVRDTCQPISCEFALRLLLTALELAEGACKTVCDWTDFEPAGLLLCLCELLEECAVLWETRSMVGPPPVPGFLKVTVKELVLQCLDKLSGLLRQGAVTLQEDAEEWLQTELLPFHWTVRLYISGVLGSHSNKELLSAWVGELEDMLQTGEGLQEWLVTLLGFISIAGPTVVTPVAGTSRETGSLEYEASIAALIQVLPNLLTAEFQHVMTYMGSLIDQGLLQVPYRPGHVTVMSLQHVSRIQKCLCVSQLLRDVLVTLTLVAMATDQTEAMLVHVSQCYVAVLQKLCGETTNTDLDLQLFVGSQLISHVSDVTATLPEPAAENTFVLLLHLLSQYEDLQHRSAKVPVLHRTVQSCGHVITMAIQRLPASSIQTEMLVKKLGDWQMS